MSLYQRLGLNFDTSRFGDAQVLSINAANTLTLIANTTGALPIWEQNDLSVGSPVRINYFKNPTTQYTNSLMSATSLLGSSAAKANDFITSAYASSLMLEISNFHSHTDNISGVVEVSNTFFPSLQSAESFGQMNMMTLSRTDGVSNTAPILGSFTSLFIQDELQANANQLIIYANEYANSLTQSTVILPGGNVAITYTSNLPSSEIIKIDNYVANTNTLISSRRTGDWTFYRNSVQLAKDLGFMQQFNSMGGTFTYMVKNLVGTDGLIANTATNTMSSIPGATGVPTSSGGSGTVVSTGNWTGNVIGTQYGGTGLQSFTAYGALYATSANTLVTGILPVNSGGTGTMSSTGSGSLVLNTAPVLTGAILLNPSITGNVVLPNIGSTNVYSSNISTTSLYSTLVVATNVSTSNVFTTKLTTTNITATGGWSGTGSSAGVLGGVPMAYHQERTGVGANTAVVTTYYPMAWGSGNGGNKGIYMPFSGKLVMATLVGQGITGTVTVQAGVNGVTNSSFQLTGTGASASSISAAGDYRNSPLSFSAGSTLGWYQLTIPSAADGFQVAFWVIFD